MTHPTSNKRFDPKHMREDALCWSRAGYPYVAIGRYRDAADEIERLRAALVKARALLLSAPIKGQHVALHMEDVGNQIAQIGELLSGDSSAPETKPEPPTLTAEQAVFNSSGSRDWYNSSWAARQVIETTLYVPMELLAAALGFLRRAQPFLEGGLPREVRAYLATYGIEVT